MANCIVARSQRPLLTVTPTFYSNRAQVVVTNPTGAVMGTFDIRQISANGTEVAYRSIYGGPGSEAGGRRQGYFRPLRAAVMKLAALCATTGTGARFLARVGGWVPRNRLGRMG